MTLLKRLFAYLLTVLWLVVLFSLLIVIHTETPRDSSTTCVDYNEVVVCAKDHNSYRLTP